VSAPARVLVAGLPDALASFLARQLPGAAVETAADAAALRSALTAGGWSLLVVEDDLPGGPARALLGGDPLPPTLLCLSRGPEGAPPPGELEALGVQRVFFHPLDRQELVRQASSALARAEDAGEGGAAGLECAVRQAWERFRGTILQRVGAVEDAAVAVLEGGLDEARRRHAEREAHKLAGSVGTFGFAQASRLAREAEIILQGSQPLEQAQALKLTDLAVALRRELDRPAAADPPQSPRDAAASASLSPAGAVPDRPPPPLVLLVDVDPELAERVAMEAAGRGMRTRTAAGVAEARALAAGEHPAAVLVDLSADRDGRGLDLIADLSARAPRIPVVVVSSRDSFTDRVDVARMGGLGFLQKPVPPTAVVDALQGVLQRERKDGGACVLLVDDDPVVLAEAARLLEGAGVKVHTLADPLRLWSALEEYAPEVVVLDVDMPLVSGIEMCRVMRNDPRWSATPVVFLTSSTGAETVQKVFAAGADDFVAKPIVGPELVTRIANRLERVQLHRALADTDPLTGVANRRRSEELMGQLLHLAGRQGQPLSLAVIDLDHFKQVNDRHGHGVGDDVLRRVARLLERSFRAEDVVARWGGEEFLVAMYGMDRDDGVQRIAEVLETLRAESFEAAGAEPFQVTFSGGVAQFPMDGAELATLYRAADAALYQAKEGGRDRVLPTGWTGGEQGAAEHVDVLVVEDDHALARLLLHALDTRGYRSRWIEDGREAAEQLTGSRPRLRARVVLMDVDLPGMDGHALLRTLARERVLERTRVIVLTVRSHESEVVQALDEGAFDHVAKPFSVAILLQRVRRAMRT
jgi:diguanylate cyclase (GGDEF)-like protein